MRGNMFMGLKRASEEGTACGTKERHHAGERVALFKELSEIGTAALGKRVVVGEASPLVDTFNLRLLQHDFKGASIDGHLVANPDIFSEENK